MNAIELLKADHQKVRDLFGRFQEKGGIKINDPIVRSITQELRVHTILEEELFYPAVREMNDEKLQELVEESLDDHQSVKEMIDEIEEGAMSDEELSEHMAMLQEDLETHLEQEETEMFPRLQKIWQEDYLDRLGTGMMDRKQRIQARAA